MEELEQVNKIMGRDCLDPEQVFAAPRQTFMRPNLIFPMLEQGIFPHYQAAKQWFAANIASKAPLGRLSVKDAIDLVHAAGGAVAVAHPGFGIVEGWLKPDNDFGDFKDMGLDAVEVYYPYASTNPGQFDANSERTLIRRLAELAARFGLEPTPGSDSHKPGEFEDRWSMVKQADE
jgi:predicted metal-dependent phosphoesterase TrpH